MRLRAKILIRNDHMIEARRAAGLSQKDLSVLASVRLDTIAAFEALQYGKIHSENISKYANKIASALNIDAELILPDGARGNANTTIEVVREIPVANMMEFKEALSLTYQPDDIVVATEERDDFRRALGCLTERERRIYELRFKKDMGIAGIGKEIGLTRARVGQLVQNIERKLKVFLQIDPVKDAAIRYHARIKFLRHQKADQV